MAFALCLWFAVVCAEPTRGGSRSADCAGSAGLIAGSSYTGALALILRLTSPLPSPPSPLDDSQQPGLKESDKSHLTITCAFGTGCRAVRGKEKRGVSTAHFAEELLPFPDQADCGSGMAKAEAQGPRVAQPGPSSRACFSGPARAAGRCTRDRPVEFTSPVSAGGCQNGSFPGPDDHTAVCGEAAEPVRYR
ncbi:hypothetical protein AAFF_G00165300 [Aldrovandia affinis]|uniref:Uncharacterized protein n=1 Tax=Aldrovandia affinis TaxID=143900 RepID=A0AAD7RMA6_9TELE|nr:hypothetical protein AAFF_G00165300 [Aldrovandia affinis]